MEYTNNQWKRMGRRPEGREEMYKITRQVCDTRPVYAIEADTEDAAIEKLEAWLGCSVKNIISIEPWSLEQEQEEMEEAGYL